MLFTKLKLISLISLISDVLHITGSSTCPNGMSPYDTGLCYRYHSESKSWPDANSYCKTKYGGTLVTIKTAHAFTLITNLIKARPGLKLIWIGASDADKDNSFNWNDGQQCCPNRWVPGQPDRSGHCLDMWRTSGGFIGFDDASCSSRLSFVCQAPECKDISNCLAGHIQCTGSSDSLHQCTKCDLGYRAGGLGKGCIGCQSVPRCEQFTCVNDTISFCTKCSEGLREINGGQFCYDADNPANHISVGDFEYFVYIDEYVTWQKAENICKLKGGNLFVPESSTMEQEVRLRLQSEFSSYTDYNFWIGARLLNSTFTDWIGKGQTEFFTRWGRKPSVNIHEQLCVSIDQTNDYKMTASPCQRNNAFICQKKLTQDVTVG